MTLFLLLAGCATGVYISYSAYLIWNALRISRQGARRVHDEFGPANATHHILILGDSTIVGAGVADRSQAMGALMASRFPQACVEVVAQNGIRIADLPMQLKQARRPNYHLVIVGVGGNDVVKLTDYAKAEPALAAFLQSLADRSSKIVLIHTVNVGNIGFFLPPLSYLFDLRTRLLSQMYGRLAHSNSAVQYINFYRPRTDDYYTPKTRAKFIAPDGFHPSDYANQFFFEIIVREAGLEKILQP